MDLYARYGMNWDENPVRATMAQMTADLERNNSKVRKFLTVQLLMLFLNEYWNTPSVYPTSI